MLLTQLKDILDIDTRIGDMHRELANLYAIRSSMVEPDYQQQSMQTIDRSKIKQLKPDVSAWCKQQYEDLLTIWKSYDIAIPSYKHLYAKLKTAPRVIDELVKARPELDGNLTVLLVPPTKLIGFPIKAKLQAKRSEVQVIDYVNSDITPPYVSKKWQVLVVYNAPSGLYLGSPETVLSSRNYLIGKHDSRGLGLLEYAALNLQLLEPIDTKSWTILFKGKTTNEQLPCVTFQDKRLRFDIEDIDSVFGDDRFRPAVVL